MIKSVIFDMDGTVTNTMPLCIRAFREALAPLAGRDFSDAEITETFGPSEEGTIKQLLEPSQFDLGLSAYLKRYSALLEPCYGPFPGIENWIQQLQAQQIKTALVTGKGEWSTKLTLDHYGLHPCFSMVETGSIHGPVKPLKIQKILSAWELTPDEVIYVGDAPSDVTAAKEVGIRIISAAWGLNYPEEVDKISALNPECTFLTIEEAASWLAKDLHSAR